MQIVTYRELESKDEFMILMEQAFGWPMTPQRLEKIINLDIRLKDSPVGFCAVENDILAGFVGVLDIPTRTVIGQEERAGGIWCVATNPRYVRKGTSKTLMDVAHRYFQQRGYSFAFLQTNRTFIACAIYEKMGYLEVDKFNQYPIAFKVLQKERSETSSMKELDPASFFDIYQESVKNKAGFVIRQSDFFNLFLERRRFDAEISVREDSGYALVSALQDVVRIGEFISLDDKTYQKILGRVEAAAQGGVIDLMVTDQKLLETYRANGYHIQSGSHMVFMVKKLAGFEFQEKYGSNFHIGMQDLF
jgi:predicted acetyltransferase